MEKYKSFWDYLKKKKCESLDYINIGLAGANSSFAIYNFSVGNYGIALLQTGVSGFIGYLEHFKYKTFYATPKNKLEKEVKFDSEKLIKEISDYINKENGN